MTDEKDKEENENLDSNNESENHSKTWEFNLKDSKLNQEEETKKSKKQPQGLSSKVKKPANIEVISEKAMTKARSGQRQETLKFDLNELKKVKESNKRSNFVEEEVEEPDFYVADTKTRFLSGLVDLLYLFILSKVSNFEPLIILSEDIYFPVAKLFDFVNKIDDAQLNILLFSFSFVMMITLFYIIPMMIFKRSFGKMIFKIRIHCTLMHTPLSSSIFLREVIFKPISILTIFGVAMIYFDEDKRALHDRIMKTVVVKK